jgi:hypothetical protein
MHFVFRANEWADRQEITPGIPSFHEEDQCECFFGTQKEHQVHVTASLWSESECDEPTDASSDDEVIQTFQQEVSGLLYELQV